MQSTSQGVPTGGGRGSKERYRPLWRLPAVMAGKESPIRTTKPLRVGDNPHQKSLTRSELSALEAAAFIVIHLPPIYILGEESCKFLPGVSLRFSYFLMKVALLRR